MNECESNVSMGTTRKSFGCIKKCIHRGCERLCVMCVDKAVCTRRSIASVGQPHAPQASAIDRYTSQFIRGRGKGARENGRKKKEEKARGKGRGPKRTRMG